MAAALILTGCSGAEFNGVEISNEHQEERDDDGAPVPDLGGTSYRSAGEDVEVDGFTLDQLRSALQAVDVNGSEISLGAGSAAPNQGVVPADSGAIQPAECAGPENGIKSARDFTAQDSLTGELEEHSLVVSGVVLPDKESAQEIDDHNREVVEECPRISQPIPGAAQSIVTTRDVADLEVENGFSYTFSVGVAENQLDRTSANVVVDNVFLIVGGAESDDDEAVSTISEVVDQLRDHLESTVAGS